MRLKAHKVFPFFLLSLGFFTFGATPFILAGSSPVISRFHEVEHPDRRGTIIVVDLDETVMRPQSFYGSEKWYLKVYENLLISENINEQAAHERATEIWGAAQNGLKMELLDPNFRNWILDRQQLNIPVIALTARRADIDRFTLDQLSEMRIGFSSLWKKALVEPALKNFLARGDSWNNGVIFAGEKVPKGVVLQSFVQHFDVEVSRIIFIDNVESHLESVRREFLSSSIEVMTYHFINSNCSRFLVN